jgi:hypothetical protein
MLSTIKAIAAIRYPDPFGLWMQKVQLGAYNPIVGGAQLGVARAPFLWGNLEDADELQGCFRGTVINICIVLNFIEFHRSSTLWIPLVNVYIAIES